MEFSYLHLSDIHLGRPFSDLSISDSKMKYCNSACKDALKNVVELAILKKVNFVLIAGDSFDDDEQDLSAKLAFIKSLKELADNGIKSYIICGNHDSVQLYKKFHNYFEFEDKYKGFINITGVTTKDYKEKFSPIDGVNIYSLSFRSDEMKNPISELEDLGSVSSKEFNIGLIHCDMDKTESKYAPVSREELKNLGYDYYALGHIDLPQDNDDNLVYSGTIQARTRKETGEHGCFYLKIKNKKVVKKEFIPVDSVRFSNIEINCSDLKNKMDVFDRVSDEVNRHRHKINLLLFQVTLNGITEAYEELNETENLLEEYIENYSDNDRKDVGVCSIINNTYPYVDDSEIMTDKGVVGIIANAEEEGIVFDDIYDEISKTHENIYKKLEIDKESQEYLLKSLQDDKEELLSNVRKELKSLCKEIYSQDR